MKKLIPFILFLFAACSDKHYEFTEQTPEPDPPVCTGEKLERMMLLEERDNEPPIITQGWLVDHDCNPETPPVFEADDEFPGQGQPYDQPE